MGEKFNKYDRVVMATAAREANSRARSFIGVVVGDSRYHNHVRILRDGLLTIEVWHKDAWELDSPRSSAFESVGKAC